MNLLRLIIIVLTFTACIGQDKSGLITTDIDNFWRAYDSIQTTNDSLKQKAFIQTIYFDNATAGLKKFMKNKNHTTEKHLKQILKFPEFWKSLRPKTQIALSQAKHIVSVFHKLKTLYPDFKPPSVFLCMGIMNSAGYAPNNKIVILGAEMVCSDSTTNLQGLNNWLKSIILSQNSFVGIVSHEIIHTQQNNHSNFNNGNASLLACCIREGACDFIGELIYQPNHLPYMKYGKLHEKELWTKFQAEAYTSNTDKWLYNGGEENIEVADLGYFMGYSICKSYYNNSTDKQKAIKDIIDLDYDEDSVKKFFEQSKYIGTNH